MQRHVDNPDMPGPPGTSTGHSASDQKWKGGGEEREWKRVVRKAETKIGRAPSNPFVAGEVHQNMKGVLKLHGWKEGEKRMGRRDEKKRHTKRPPNAARTEKNKRSFRSRTLRPLHQVPGSAPVGFQLDRLATVVAPGLGLPAPAPAHELGLPRRLVRAPWPL